MHYRRTGGPHAHRSFNNIFIAVNPEAAIDRQITFVPPPSFPGPTDGNCYFRIGFGVKPLLRFLEYTLAGPPPFHADADEFLDLEALKASELFKQSKAQYPPGYEAQSIEIDPRFRHLAADGSPEETDDLRLLPTSPARHQGITLPDDLGPLDAGNPSPACPDIGCFPYGSDPLRVGVDGRRQLPAPSR